MVTDDSDLLSADLPPIDSMFNLSLSPATKAMPRDYTSAVPFLTLDHVVPSDPIDTHMETQPPLLPNPDMTCFSSASDQVPRYHVASLFRRGGHNQRH